MSWSAYPVLALFLFCAYYVLRFIQRRSQYINLPKLAEGQWHPLVANYNWSSSENRFRDEFNSRLKSSDATPTTLAQLLMKRAMFDVEQMMEMQQQKSTLQQLVKTGSIGEEVYLRFQRAEELLNAECQEVAEHAASLKPGWQEQIFQQASQMLQIEKRRQAEVDMKREEEDRQQQMEWSQERAKEDLKQRELESRRLADELIREEEREKRGGNGRKKSK